MPQQQSPWRRLADGTWYNREANVVAAPLTDSPVTRKWKTRPSPPQGSGGMLVTPPTLAPQVAPAAALNGYYGGAMGMHMRHGRNYAALGAEPLLSSAAGRTLAIVAIVGVAGLTVWLQNRSKKAKKD